MNEVQPYYKLLINGVDSTEDVSGSVVYEEKEDLINTLTFSLEKGLMYLGGVIREYKTLIEFWGGTTDPDNQRLFFRGHVVYIRSDFSKTGITKCRIICHSMGKGGKSFDKNVFFYPGTDSARSWANVSSLKASEIIRNIVTAKDCMNAKLGKIDGNDAIVLPADPVYTHKNPLKQSYESNWAFLRRLCQSLETVVWEEMNDNGEAEIFVAAKDPLRTIASKYSFVFVSQDGENYSLDNQAGSQFSIKQLESMQIQLFDINIDEDSDAAHGIVRTVSKFGDDGNTEILFSKYDEETGKFYEYKLNEERVRNEPVEVQDRIQEIVMNADQYAFEDVLKYYDRVEKTEDQNSKSFGVKGRPFVGIRASMSFAGNVNIASKRSYAITGISKRYDSEGNKKLWYMQELVHTWDDSGYICEAKMFR